MNLERVMTMETYTKESRVVVLTDGKQLPVSLAEYNQLMELLR